MKAVDRSTLERPFLRPSYVKKKEKPRGWTNGLGLGLRLRLGLGLGLTLS